MLTRFPIAPGARPPLPTQSREGALQRHLKALGRAGLLVTVSAVAAQAQLAAPTTPPDPPTFAAQGIPNFVSIKDIFAYKALPEYHEPDWVTEQFVKSGKLPPVKDRRRRSRWSIFPATCPMAWALMATSCVT